MKFALLPALVSRCHLCPHLQAMRFSQNSRASTLDFYTSYARNAYSKRRDKFVKHAIEGDNNRHYMCICKIHVCTVSSLCICSTFQATVSCHRLFECRSYLSVTWRFTGDSKRDREKERARANASATRPEHINCPQSWPPSAAPCLTFWLICLGLHANRQRNSN